MSTDDALFRDPGEETKLRLQNDKETLGAVSSQDPPPWNVGDQLDDFVLEELLGSGSSGVVYRALDLKTKRYCALKMLKRTTPDDLLRNKLGFRRMMSIEHPNLLRVDRIYQLGEYTALSMEEVDGRTLGRAITEYKNLDADFAYEKLLKLMRDFASGLAAMHAAGFIHRDIKPENLMVDSDGNGRVIDYGLVDTLDLDQTIYGARGFLVGTPHYFAPEVIWSQRYLPAGDVFSLGIVMLDALRRLQRSSKAKSSGPRDSASRSPKGRVQDRLDAERASVERSDSNRLDDAQRIDEAIQELPQSVPTVIRSACREMLERDPAERPTAMELARLGLPPSGQFQWPHTDVTVGREVEREAFVTWVNGVFAGDKGRFHLTGPSGIGKTRLIEEIVGYIESKNWGQIFTARCKLREDQPLQAFDQICDAIANRYMKGDRERLELDPVSVAILQNIFPVLSNILTCSTRLTPASTATERLDALEAAARMSEQLRLVGPLFLVIDDSQWADRDSLGVLDRLQTVTGGEGLGIITVSRDSEDPQRVPATEYIQLGPLAVDDAARILASSANRWSVEVTPGLLRDLAKLTGGTPFRVRELADEFRPGGALADLRASDESLTRLGQIDRLWQKRAQRLSTEAMLVLPLIVTAGGRVSTQQLGELTGLGDSVDAAVSELARQRLVIDEATGGECIRMFHDHVADEVIGTLSDDVKRTSHHAWASLLARQDSPERWSARIAGHFFAAHEPARAVAHAILAAEDAERLVAMSEAARWYERVVKHTKGEERLCQLRNAARCYREADFPSKAAECFQKLAQLVDDDERTECQVLATALLIRSGRFSQVREQLRELGDTLQLPKPKSPLRSRLALMVSGLRLAVRGESALLSQIAKDVPMPGDDGQPASADDPPAMHCRQQQSLRLCLSLVRPMLMFDSLYAAELNAAAALLSLRHGDPAQRVHVAVGQAIFDCYDMGDRRIRGEATLLELKPHVARLNSGRARGDLWAGHAYSHALACRWDQVSQPVQSSIENFNAAADSHSFDLAHTQWLDLWANWNLGRWTKMQRTSDAMFDDATRRSDLFQQLLTTSGFGAATWLIRDMTAEWTRIQAINLKSECNLHQTQLFHVFDWIASIQNRLYEGNFKQAWATYESLESSLRTLPYSRIQLIRVSRLALGALVALHNLHGNDALSINRIRGLTNQLRQERIGFARTLANLYEGLLLRQTCKASPSDDSLERARQLLWIARDEARDRQLRPYQLAAEDALAEIHTGASLQLLADRMKSQGVVCPDRLQRLYTVVEE